MEITASPNYPVDDAPVRQRARARLYVICQTLGWGFVLVTQLVFATAFPESDSHREPIYLTCVLVMISAIGLLVSHGLRPLVSRLGWKQMGWRQLLPRILAISVASSVLWNGLGFAYTHGLLSEPWPARYSPLLLYSLSCVDGTIIFFGWLCLYFFYHLFERLNRSEIDRFQLMTHVKDAELRALKSQVNPHFIFNSLNSLRALIGEDPVRARQAVTQLANLLRYSLQSGQLETVPFEEELRIVNDYLALEQVRHEERLRLRLDVDPDTLNLPVPPMLLQTLVENAVKYGISPRPDGGEIAIIARRNGDTLRLQVTNPGEIEPSRGGSSTGMGLNNAAERLRLIFGSRATLRLLGNVPSLVVAEATIPLALRP